MGCDIHVFIEYKVGVKGAWKLAPCHYSNDSDYDYDIEEHKITLCECTNRDYNLFSKLAGVRGSDDVITKGFPKDMSEGGKIIGKFFIDDRGYHTPHYMTYNNFKKIVLKCGYKIPDKSLNPCIYYGFNLGDYGTILRYIEDLKVDHELENSLLDIKTKTYFRIVMFFDS